MDMEIATYGLLKKGTATIPNQIMTDAEVSIEAKGIYAYLAGFEHKPKPSLQRILNELGITEYRYFKHREDLLKKGYLRIN